MSGIVHPAQASHSSPPSNSARSRLHLPASKLVRRARESRYLGGGFGGGGGGGAIEFGFESSLEESPRLSFTTLSESDQSSAQDPGWYKAHYPTSGLEVQTYARDMPYFLSFAASSADWDSLMTSALEGCAAYSTANARIDSAGNEVVRAPPRRVLDVGCGSGHWMLGQAFVRGWEETEFVGLDAAPSRFDGGVLPPSLSGRVSHVQHDFLREPLPFLDNHFDFVRIARMNVAIPEIKWMELLEECVRVLTPGSYFEVAEVDFAIYKRHEQVQRIFDSVFDHQFLNSRPLTVIPSNLTLVARDMRSTGRIATRLPSGPSFSEDRHCTDSEPILSANLPPLRKFAAGSDPTLDTPRSSIMSHLALHSYAGHLASSSWGIANAALEARDAGRASSEEDGSGRNMTTSRRERELGHVMDAVENYADELKDRAGIAQLVTARLGWDPTFDKKLERQLHDNLPILEDRVRLFAVERRNGDAAFGGQQDPEIEFRYQQAELARRECQHDIQQVRHRLEGMHDENEQDLELGSMDLEVFVARAP